MEQAISQRVAERVLKGFADVVGRPAVLVGSEPDDETGGHVLRFTVALESPTWSEDVVDLLATAQRLGAG